MSRNTKIGIGLIVVLFITAAALSAVMVSGDKIHSNIRINGINVGGFVPSQAENMLKEKLEPVIDDLDITLRFKEKEWKLRYRDFNFQ